MVPSFLLPLLLPLYNTFTYSGRRGERKRNRSTGRNTSLVGRKNGTWPLLLLLRLPLPPPFISPRSTINWNGPDFSFSYYQLPRFGRKKERKKKSLYNKNLYFFDRISHLTSKTFSPFFLPSVSDVFFNPLATISHDPNGVDDQKNSIYSTTLWALRNGRNVSTTASLLAIELERVGDVWRADNFSDSSFVSFKVCLRKKGKEKQ